MVQGLVFIVGIYMLAAVSVHAAYRFTRKTQGGEHCAQYVLHTYNDSRHLEWAIRTLTIYSWLCSRPITITIQDEGSTDDTCAVASLLSRRYGLHMDSFSTDSYWNRMNHTSRNSTTNLPAYSTINTSSNSRKRLLQNSRINTSITKSFTVSHTSHSFDPKQDVIHIRLSNPADWKRLPFACQVN
jgi:hypothetical protein